MCRLYLREQLEMEMETVREEKGNLNSSDYCPPTHSQTHTHTLIQMYICICIGFRLLQIRVLNVALSPQTYKKGNDFWLNPCRKATTPKIHSIGGYTSIFAYIVIKGR